MAHDIPHLSLLSIHNHQELQEIYADTSTNYYWSADWSKNYYMSQAKAGFIAVLYDDPELGEILLPELQFSYALLDWENLRIPRATQKIFKSSDYQGGRYKLLQAPSPGVVMDGIASSYSNNWLRGKYQDLMHSFVPASGDPHFEIVTWELHDVWKDKVIAGELGYRVGTIYTSLSGFFDRGAIEYSGFGWVQLVILAQTLREQSYSWWNLGHPHMEYKVQLGAKIVQRRDFLERWHPCTQGKLEATRPSS